jgi:4-amino-4-deoxy-L-arabinose transferase-like glycosyltransferase
MQFEVDDFKRLALVLFFTALAARLLFIGFRGAYQGIDSVSYLRLAANIANHLVYSTDPSAPYLPSIRYAPGYSTFLALMDWFGLLSPWRIAAAQGLIDSAVAVLVFLLARYSVPTRWAAGAGLLYCVHPGAIFLSSAVLTEAVFTALLACSVWLLVRSLYRRHPLTALAAGLVIGLAALSRAIALPVPFIIGVTLLCSYALIGSRKTAAQTAILFVVGAGVVTLPWTIRCTLLAHSFVPVQAASAAQVYMPTRWDWDQSDAGLPWRRLAAEDQYGGHLYSATSPPEMADADRFGYRLAWENIRDHPKGYFASRIAAYPHLIVTSFDFFSGINQSFSELARQHDLWRILIKAILLIGFSTAPLIAALVGLGRIRTNLSARLCAVILIYVVLFHIPMWIEYRYWQPFVPYLAVTSIVGAYSLREVWVARATRNRSTASPGLLPRLSKY